MVPYQEGEAGDAEVSSSRDRKVLAAMSEKQETAAQIAARTGLGETYVLGTLRWMLSKNPPRVLAGKDGWAITSAGKDFLAKGNKA